MCAKRGKQAQDVDSRAPDGDRKPAEKPLSLRPLEFEEAVRGLLRVRPEKRNEVISAAGVRRKDDG